MSSERLLGEITFDFEYLESYLAVREVKLADGRQGGVIIASGDDPEEVHAAMRKDRQQNGGARYHFYKPAKIGEDRIGWMIGGNR